MKQLVDMSNKSDIGIVDWEFIHDMQGIAPELITPQLISLTHEFLEKIPEKWHEIKKKLEMHAAVNHIVYAAISDIENLGDDFKLRASLKDKSGKILSFYKVVIYDEDKFEDDFIGAVITDKNGEFSLNFGKKTFSDFGLEAEPDIYFKVYEFENAEFKEIGRVMPEVFEKTTTIGKKTILEFGVVTLA